MSSFKVDTLVVPNTSNSGLSEDAYSGAMAMGIAADGRIFVPKMKGGQVRVYKPGAANTSLVGTVPTYFSGEDGMLGIALDPDFMTNKWIYLYYSDVGAKGAGSQANRRILLSRFTLDTNLSGTSGLGQLTNQKIILTHPRDSVDDRHGAGGMMFDSTGVLVIGTGDNADRAEAANGYGPFHYALRSSDAQKSSSNTNDLRGKVLRITPKKFPDSQTPAPGLGATYDVPNGNLWEKISDPVFNPGWNAQDTLTKVRKEIYALGVRNPYRPRVDSRSGWIFWGDPGPDAQSAMSTRGPAGHDEWNLATGPGFFGHPYCNGYNVPYNKITAMTGSTATYGDPYNCAATENVSPWNTGIRHLPPAVSALVAYSSGTSTDDDIRFGTTYATSGPLTHTTETAISGPMYRFNPALSSKKKFPAYYEGKIFFLELSRRMRRVINIKPDGTIDTGAAGVQDFSPSGLPLASYIDMQFGPDGMLYMLKWADNYGGTLGTGPGIFRVAFNDTTYDNSCYAPFVHAVGPGPSITVPTGIVGGNRPALKAMGNLLVNSVVTLPFGYRQADIYDLSGRKVWAFRRDKADHAANVRLPDGLSTGVLRVMLKP